jgi:hypothetical protein
MQPPSCVDAVGILSLQGEEDVKNIPSWIREVFG